MLLADEATQLQAETALLALELTDRLLNAWAAAVAAAAPGQQRRQLHEVYSEAKSRLLSSLLRQALALQPNQPGACGLAAGLRDLRVGAARAAAAAVVQQSWRPCLGMLTDDWPLLLQRAKPSCGEWRDWQRRMPHTSSWWTLRGQLATGATHWAGSNAVGRSFARAVQSLLVCAEHSACWRACHLLCACAQCSVVLQLVSCSAGLWMLLSAGSSSIARWSSCWATAWTLPLQPMFLRGLHPSMHMCLCASMSDLSSEWFPRMQCTAYWLHLKHLYGCSARPHMQTTFGAWTRLPSHTVVPCRLLREGHHAKLLDLPSQVHTN